MVTLWFGAISQQEDRENEWQVKKSYNGSKDQIIFKLK